MSSVPTPAAVELASVSKSYGGFRAVDSVDLAVPSGTIFGLLGPNGAGKTTTIRMILDLVPPDSGRVRVLGGAAGFEANQRVGYLPEERGLYRKMRVVDQLVFFAGAKGVDRPTARRRAHEWLERLGLGSWAKKKTEELSKGMQQKIQFAGTMLHEPELLILDEPFSGLDPVNTGLLKEEVLAHRKRGGTVIFSTHVLEQAEKLCDRVAMIDRSRLVLEGEMSELRERFRRNVVRVRVGGDPAPLRGLPGVASMDVDGTGAVDVALEPGVDLQAFLRDAAARMPIHEFARKDPTLEEIFLQVVSRDRA